MSSTAILVVEVKISHGNSFLEESIFLENCHYLISIKSSQTDAGEFARVSFSVNARQLAL